MEYLVPELDSLTTPGSAGVGKTTLWRVLLSRPFVQ